jgi:hypothetical protein
MVVARSVFTPVALLVTDTLAPGIAAPLGSTITPWIEPLPAIWANAEVANSASSASEPTRRHAVLRREFMMLMVSRRNEALFGARLSDSRAGKQEPDACGPAVSQCATPEDGRVVGARHRCCSAMKYAGTADALD